MKPLNKSSSHTRKRTMITDNTNFTVLEAYKTLRTNLGFALHKTEGCKKIIFSSAFPGEGKTTTAVNVAIVFAQTGSKVLLLDCDLRKPHIHSYFHMKNTIGLSNYLEGTTTDIKDIVIETEQPSLSIVTAGVIPPNPSELLSTERFSELIKKFETHFDYIIFDTPPVNVVTDVLAVASNADGIALVVKQNSTVHPAIRDALEAFEFGGVKVLGFVLNCIDPLTVSSYKRHYYRSYNKKYGYKYARYGRKYESSSSTQSSTTNK